MAWLALALVTHGVASSARAHERPSIDLSSISMEVPADCGTPDAFLARVEALGATTLSARMEVRVGVAWSGLFRGVLRVDREGAEPVERMIEDDVCADVVDALAISAALVLRSPAEPLREPPRESPPDPSAERPADVVEALPNAEVDVAPVVTPSGTRLAGWVSGAFRLGLGPVPGLSVAPDLGAGLEVDRFVVGLHVLYWPEAGAPGTLGSATAQGVALQAVGSTLELGARIGDDVGILPSAVLEVGAAFARGVGIERPRTEVAFTCDVGASLVGYVEVGPARFFVRADVLFALAQPAYVLSLGTAYETPLVRGTGSAGIALVLGP